MWPLLKFICGLYALIIYCNLSLPINGGNVKEGINIEQKKTKNRHKFTKLWKDLEKLKFPMINKDN